MAVKRSKWETFLYDLPYGITREIVLSLDADKSWELLASAVGYTFDRIKLLELEYFRYNGSPSRALLWDYGCSNACVKDLYQKFSQINRIREMQILENYVNNLDMDQVGAAAALPNKAPTTPVQPHLIADPLNLPRPPSPNYKKNNENEVNFNQPSMSSKVNNKPSPMAMSEKHYDDKVIPGHQVKKPSHEAVEAVDSSIIKMSSHREPQESTTSSSVTSSLSSMMPSSSSSSSVWPPSDSSNTSSPDQMYQSMQPSLKNVPMEFASSLAGTSSFQYSELDEATGHFSPSNKLGEGAFGIVYHGLLRDNMCAIKRLLGERKGENGNQAGQLQCELSALLKYRHENIMTLYGYAVDGPSLCLVYQYMVNGSFEDRLQCKDNTVPLSWSNRINIVLGASHGLHFLHSMGQKPLIHGDIKSANILLDKHLEAKIGDLGQAQHATGGSVTGKYTHITKKDMNSSFYGTQAYFPPEVLRGSELLSTKSDVFSFGVVLLEAATGEKAYDERREPNKFLASHIRDLVDEKEEKEWPGMCDAKAGPADASILIQMLTIANQCVSEKKKGRPEIKEVMTTLQDIQNKFLEMSFSSQPVSCHMSWYSGHSGDAGGDMAANLSMVTPSPTGIEPFSPTSVYHAKRLPGKFARQGSGSVQFSPHSYIHNQADGNNSSGGALALLPPGCPVPESILMQQEYDRRNMAPGQREESTLSPDSDPQKLALIQEHDRQLRIHHQDHLTSLPAKFPSSFMAAASAGSEDEEPKLCALEHFDEQNPPQSYPNSLPPKVPSSIMPMSSAGSEVEEPDLRSDPDKLRELKLFDEHNSLCKNEKAAQNAKTPESLSDFYSPPSDPNKLKYLKIFDDQNVGVSDEQLVDIKTLGPVPRADSAYKQNGGSPTSEGAFLNGSDKSDDNETEYVDGHKNSDSCIDGPEGDQLPVVSNRDNIEDDHKKQRMLSMFQMYEFMKLGGEYMNDDLEEDKGA